MKKYARGSNKMVMLGLLAVLLISLGYLSMQGKEGMEDKKKEEAKMGSPSMPPRKASAAPSSMKIPGAPE
jgi:hypothetical protein